WLQLDRSAQCNYRFVEPSSAGEGTTKGIVCFGKLWPQHDRRAIRSEGGFQLSRCIEQHTEPKMSLAMIRLELDRPAIRYHRLDALTGCAQRLSQAKVRCGRFWHQRDGRAVLASGLRQLAFLCQRDTKAVMSLGMIGLQRNCIAVCSRCIVELTFEE